MLSGESLQANVEGLLAGLNPPQQEAVTHGDGPLLIFAGAGSGKTRVLTVRIAYLIATHKVWPDRLLAVTFTNKAAREMRARVETLVGEGARKMWVGTFHATAVRILRREAERLGIASSSSCSTLSLSSLKAFANSMPLTTHSNRSTSVGSSSVRRANGDISIGQSCTKVGWTSSGSTPSGSLPRA